MSTKNTSSSETGETDAENVKSPSHSSDEMSHSSDSDNSNNGELQSSSCKESDQSLRQPSDASLLHSKCDLSESGFSVTVRLLIGIHKDYNYDNLESLGLKVHNVNERRKILYSKLYDILIEMREAESGLTEDETILIRQMYYEIIYNTPFDYMDRYYTGKREDKIGFVLGDEQIISIPTDVLDFEWYANRKIMYNILQCLVELPAHRDPKCAFLRQTNEKFCNRLVSRFFANFLPELDANKILVHKVYFVFQNKRNMLRKALVNILLDYNCSGFNCPGTEEILKIFASIISGFNVPLRSENRVLFAKVILPLMKQKNMTASRNSRFEIFMQCMMHFFSKDANLVEMTLKKIYVTWPKTNVALQVIYLQIIERAIAFSTKEIFVAFIPHLFQIFAYILDNGPVLMYDRLINLAEDPNIAAKLNQFPNILQSAYYKFIYPRLLENKQLLPNNRLKWTDLDNKKVAVFQAIYEIIPPITNETLLKYQGKEEYDIEKRNAINSMWDKLNTGEARFSQEPISFVATHSDDPFGLQHNFSEAATADSEEITVSAYDKISQVVSADSLESSEENPDSETSLRSDRSLQYSFTSIKTSESEDENFQIAENNVSRNERAKTPDSQGESKNDTELIGGSGETPDFEKSDCDSLQR